METDVAYQFIVRIVNPIPIDGYLVLGVPAGVGVPVNPPTDLTYTCESI